MVIIYEQFSFKTHLYTLMCAAFQHSSHDYPLLWIIKSFIQVGPGHQFMDQHVIVLPGTCVFQPLLPHIHASSQANSIVCMRFLVLLIIYVCE